MENNKKLSDKVIIAIKNDIAGGRLKKGEKIPAEHELMEIYKVGRSTIREAVKTLSISGVLKVQQGSGTFVTSGIKDETLSQRLKRADFDELNSTKAILEKEIAKLACTNRTAQDLTLIYDLLKKRKLAIDANKEKKCIEADIQFHIAIAKASGNSILADLYQGFTKVLQSYFAKRETENIAHFLKSQDSHEALAKAIEDRDQASAEKFTQHIINNNY